MIVEQFYQTLDGLFKNNRTSEIETFMRQSLLQAQEEGDYNGMIAVENELGGLCRAKGELQEAKKLYRDVLHQLSMLGQSETVNYATALINAGDVYIIDKDFQQALSYFEEAERLLKKADLQEDYRMAALYNNISAIYREQGRLPEAERVLARAVAIIAEQDNAQSELATTYVNIGQLQIKQGKFQQAKESLQKANTIFESVFLGKDIHYAMANAALGEVYFMEGRYDLSEKSYEKALILIERDFGRNDSYRLVRENLERVQRLKGGL